jgi:hypothetical protein
VLSCVWKIFTHNDKLKVLCYGNIL